jgi:hypothetical protein
MTDDELERALIALPLEEPPTDLRRRILAATIARPRLAFNAWETWLVGTLLAFVVWLMFLVGTSVPNVGGVISQTVSVGIDRLGAAISVNTLVWMALGVSFAVWISQLSLPQPRREMADR